MAARKVWWIRGVLTHGGAGVLPVAIEPEIPPTGQTEPKAEVVTTVSGAAAVATNAAPNGALFAYAQFDANVQYVVRLKDGTQDAVVAEHRTILADTVTPIGGPGTVEGGWTISFIEA